MSNRVKISNNSFLVRSGYTYNIVFVFYDNL